MFIRNVFACILDAQGEEMQRSLHRMASGPLSDKTVYRIGRYTLNIRAIFYNFAP
jgi:hypothetical protein